MTVAIGDYFVVEIINVSNLILVHRCVIKNTYCIFTLTLGLNYKFYRKLFKAHVLIYITVIVYANVHS